jgi:two-component system sensor histidine kinase RpfC
MGELWHKYLNRFKQAPDREPEQSIVRLVIAFLMCLYSLYISLFIQTDHVLALILTALVYTFCSILIILIITWQPLRFRIRRIITMSLDVNAVTLAMWFGGESTAMLYIFYLWVSLGNGFRFGTPSLYFTSTLATLGFASVIYISDFWNGQQILGRGLLVGLLITTLYVAILLQRIEREKERAEISSQAKSRFLANMSHEIRTPLNGVVGMTDLLARTPLGGDQREIMSAIQASAETLLNLIEEILDFSKIEAGKVEINLTDQDISLHVDAVVSMLKPAAEAKGLELYHWLDLDISPVIKTDPKLLRQILINLLNNAIKYTEQGSVVLKVLPFASMDPEDSVPRVLFEVIDTGIGISGSQQKRIFERFEQIDDSTTTSPTGSGLGITITKQLVELLGGSIGVESHLGEGSRFWFYIPAIPGEDTIDETQFQDARVLLFSDILSESQELLDGLQEWHVNINVCNSIAEGFFELLNGVKVEKHYDIAIIDETQVDLSSDELLHTVRSEQSLDDLTLICVTQNSPNRKREVKLCHDGFSAVVTTPITNEKIRHVLKYALKRKRNDSLLPTIFTSAESGQSHRARILLAEDNPINQKVAKKILELQGHQVKVVSFGQEAINILNEEVFDLAILDLKMPDIGGIDIIKSYRMTHEDKSGMPFMILTANATQEAAKQCEAVGVDAYLTKPIRSARLLEVVQDLLGEEVSDVSTDTVFDHPIQMDNQEKSGRVLDTKTLKELDQLSKNPRFLAKLSESFIRDCELELASMNQAMEDRRLCQYKDSAHAMADNASGIGAFSLMAICSTASRIEESKFDNEGQQLMTRIASTFNLTCQALKYYLNSKKSH